MTLYCVIELLSGMATKGKGKSAFITTINNQNLRDQLLRWIDLARAALDLPNPSSERTNAIYTFVRTFVPPDVTEDDIDHFSNSLAADEVFVFLTKHPRRHH